MSRPYKDIFSSENKIIREFGDDIDPIELMWHRDLKTRQITILEGTGWSYQQEDSLPKQLNPGDQIVIPALEWHRVIKGTTNLKLKIEEY